MKPVVENFGWPGLLAVKLAVTWWSWQDFVAAPDDLRRELIPLSHAAPTSMAVLNNIGELWMFRRGWA